MFTTWLPAIFAALCLHIIVCILLFLPSTTTITPILPIVTTTASLHIIWLKKQAKQVNMQTVVTPSPVRQPIRHIPVVINVHKKTQKSSRLLTPMSPKHDISPTLRRRISPPVVKARHLPYFAGEKEEKVNIYALISSPPALVGGVAHKCRGGSSCREGSTNKGLSAIFIANIQAKVRYPRLARQHNWQGLVLLTLHVRQQQLMQVTVRQSSGHAMLDRSAIRALKRASLSGIANGNYTLPVQFYLQNN